MWQTFSIRTQLLILLSSLLLVIASATMGLAFWLDKQQRQTVAVELASTLTNALSQDMLKAILSNQTDSYADLSFRLNQFDSVKYVILFNQKNEAIFKTSEPSSLNQNILNQVSNEPQFYQSHLYIKLPIEVDGNEFGRALYIIDIRQLTTQLNQQILWLGIAIPIELLIGLILATRISRRYSKPIEAVAYAMQHANPTEEKPQEIHTPFKNEIRTIYHGFNKMVQQVYKATERQRYLSEHDQLTGLYNRYYLECQVKTLLKQDSTAQHSLISMDLTQFKLINDSAGMAAGDELLKMVAHQCGTLMPLNAILTRLEANTFSILLKNTSSQDSQTLAKTLLENLSDFRFSWEGQAYSISASIGLIYFKPNQFTLTELLKNLDNALIHAKASGRNKAHLYQVGEQEISLHDQDARIAAQIKQALIKEGDCRFELFAQAIVPLQYKTNKVGYEILIRMFDEQNNLIPPNSFLPTAERYQLMSDIDQFVLVEYLSLVSQQPEHIKKLHSAHVNLSGSSLNHPDFQQTVRNAIDQFDFPWHKLELEITETSAVGNFNQANEFIHEVKQKGIGLALDDFGTGMSSFEYLKSLPFDIVKIDGSFVKDMQNDPTDKAVIKYIQEISALRNQETIAEYVEDQACVDELTEIGITYGQGYHLGKPYPLKDWF